MTRKKCSDALARFGVNTKLARCFAFARITASVRITCRRNALLAAAERGGGKCCDAMHDRTGTGGNVVGLGGPLRQSKLNRIGANADLRHRYLRQSFYAVV